ncbi:hypothetical protein GGX14DRAFT_479094, partial [Mycena pura]
MHLWRGGRPRLRVCVLRCRAEPAPASSVLRLSAARNSKLRSLDFFCAADAAMSDGDWDSARCRSSFVLGNEKSILRLRPRPRLACSGGAGVLLSRTAASSKKQSQSSWDSGRPSYPSWRTGQLHPPPSDSGARHTCADTARSSCDAAGAGRV